MYSEEAVLELVELIYRAAGEPSTWSEVLERLGAALGGCLGAIHYQNTVSKWSNVTINWAMDPAAVEAYAYYATINPWWTRTELIAEGNVFTTEMLYPDELLLRTEFYDGWLRTQDVHRGIGGTILKSGTLAANLSIMRPTQAAQFDEKDLELVRVLMPHLQRAFQLHNRIQALERKGNAAADALDQLQQGVVLLDAKGRVLLVNRAATALFAAEKTLQLNARGLLAANSAENRQLNALIQGAIATGSGNGSHSGGAMSISRADFRQPLQILVMPLRTAALYLGKDLPVAGIFISDPEKRPVSDNELLRQLYGLTPAESRLAQMLAAGESLNDAAEKLRVATSTVRSQLKSIFAKTNTHRQSDLVRVLLRLPAEAGDGQRHIRTE